MKRMTMFLLAGSLFFAVAAQDSVQPVMSTASDSVVTYASSQYQSGSFLRKLIMGNNYRTVWQHSVTIPVFHFSGSGFSIQELGGGMQTKSLHLKDRDGKEWSLRTVDKDVSQANFGPFKVGLAYRMVQDLISAAFPYAASIAGELVHATGIACARPQVYFVADDTAFGEHRTLFANTVCMLEERDPGFDSTVNSFTMLKNIRESQGYKIEQRLLLKARLLDIIMGDWDRHADNWRWGPRDSAGFTYYYAVPRDRDWAFYKSGGWLPHVVQSFKAMPHLVSFNPDLKNIKYLSHKAWTIDKELLNEMDASDWEAAINDVQNLLSNNVIEAAVKKLPQEIYDISGPGFITTLKSRRDALKDEVMKYYRFQAEEVIINGSDEEETFSISTRNDSLIVAVTAAHNKTPLYYRSFSDRDTYFITLNGLGGTDSFEMSEEAKSKIKIIIYGGAGADQYNIKGHIKTKIYDSRPDNDLVVNKGPAKVYFR